MVKLVQDVQSNGVVSGYVNSYFDKAKAELERQGYRVIPSEENVRLRIEQTRDLDISKFGNYVSEGALYVQGKGRFILRNSLVMICPEKATRAHKQRKAFFVSDEDVEKALQDSVIVPYDKTEIPTNRFGEDEVTAFTFGEQAKSYGDFLRENKINQMPISLNGLEYVNQQGNPFTNQIWLRGLIGLSVINSNGIDLSFRSRVRGVKNINAEGNL